MKAYYSPSTDPAYNLALEEQLLEAAVEKGEDYLLFYCNRPCLVVGRSQSVYAELRWLSALNDGVEIHRRKSGGGAVYHDEGNLNFALLFHQAPWGAADYASCLEPLVRLLREKNTPFAEKMRATSFGGEAKFSGHARSLRRGGLLHHGTVLCSSDLSRLGRYLPQQLSLRQKGLPPGPPQSAMWGTT